MQSSSVYFSMPALAIKQVNNILFDKNQCFLLQSLHVNFLQGMKCLSLLLAFFRQGS